MSNGNVDLVDYKTIYLSTDIITGSGYYFQGGASHIIHSFANNYANGVQAFDHDKKPIDFSGEQFVLELSVQA